MKIAIRLLLALVPLLAGAQNLKEFEKRVTEFTLPNGLHFIVVERHEAPVVSFHTYVNAGSVDDPSGATGIAHMFEHMAFKGTQTIGTRDWPAEKKAIEEVEQAYDELEAERNKGVRADPAKITHRRSAPQGCHDQGQRLRGAERVSAHHRGERRRGAQRRHRAWTPRLFLQPALQPLELWFLLESQRFLQPVFREFYKERDVVQEERRMRVESNPQGKLVQAFLATAFVAHPYRRMGGGLGERHREPARATTPGSSSASTTSRQHDHRPSRAT